MKRPVHFNIDEVKHRASGRWVEILSAAGIPSELLESRRGMPCPRCGGSDRFGTMRDLAMRGAVLCRHCFNGDTDPRAGDGLATLRWWLGVSLTAATEWLGLYLGCGHAAPRVREIVQSISIPREIDRKRFALAAEVWARNMRPEWLEKAAAMLGLPIEPLVRLGVGWSPEHRATSWPMRDGEGIVIGIRLRCPQTTQKWAVRGSAAGLFYCPTMLAIERPERLWCVEGPTDTAALLSVGLSAVGVPSAGGGADLLVALARRVRPGEVVIVADRDDAGRRGAERLADALVIVAPVRVATPPEGVKDARAWVVGGADRAAIESMADSAPVRSIVMGEVNHG
ncbi:primase-helicase zinc-binding domain-containing protein [Pirellula sp. SH-Sr6A]|uniref:primase-helicase zinc-binding domain-containing protein n=1 Tax=Pirellula sp. SH-Sr6A TaxID=1632865 RepID=UPI0014394512|nr:primase-helicase zinc-binding domain-containing protein [Pirellula sp. SH-Sr6A]